ncbi:MAG: ABC transporter substrate-binding protein [Candidatus Latescibacteria bacterium]|nr:ABC transporter substrate-binding protein [Candidatus Latescibacterota bacterium]
MSRSALIFVARLALVGLGLALVIQLCAHFTFALAGAGDVDLEALTTLEAPQRQADSPGALHQVAEWPSQKEQPFSQAPLLEDRDLPPVAQRLPANPLVIVPPHQQGPYGGTWTRFGTGPSDIGIFGARLAYDGLVRWGPMGREIRPNLATHWTIADSGRSYTFHLRQGVRWSDGQPFTSADILFWYEHILQQTDLTPVPPIEFRHGGTLVQVDAPDQYTIRFRFAAPYGLFLKVLASNFSNIVEYPAHYLKQFHPDFTPQDQLDRQARRQGRDFWFQIFSDRREWRNPDMPRLWAWTVSQPPPARPVVFSRNPYYWKVDPAGQQLPYIDHITFDIYDAETINIKAINGEVGMQGRHITFQNYPLFMTNQEQGGYRVHHWLDGGDGMIALALNLNHKDPILKRLFHDRLFRRALSQALDRDAINEACFMGVGQPRQIAPPPQSAYYDAAYEKAYTKYDPAQARRLLDAMGWHKMDERGRRLRPDGKPLTLQLETSSTMVGAGRMFEMTAAYWTAIGVETKVKMMARQLYGQRRSALLCDVMVWSGAGEIIPVLDPRWFLPYNTGSFHGLDYVRWFRSGGSNGEEPPAAMQQCIDLFGQVQRAVDEDEQIRLFRKIIDINRENLWVIGTIGQIPQLFIVQESFRNVPEVAVACWPLRTPGATAPECYAIEGGNQL